MATILVVDEYLSIGLLYREVLQDEGHLVFVALSGKEALDLALHERVDLAIVDDTLPDVEADELLRELKQLQEPVKGILDISSDFSSPHDPHLWDGIFIKSNNFIILQAKVKRLLEKSSGTI